MPRYELEAVDPDVDLRAPGPRRERRVHWDVLAVIAVGGMAGASGRYALELAWPTPAGSWPWATFVTNASGCLLIGMLMVYVVEAGRAHPLIRPFVGVGVLGGFTTFSTYAVQSVVLVDDGHAGLAVGYLFGTLAAALVAVTAGVALARTLIGLRRWLARRTHQSREETR
jgi:CrcB protein